MDRHRQLQLPGCGLLSHHMLMSVMTSILMQCLPVHSQQATVTCACSHNTVVSGSMGLEESSPASSWRFMGDGDGDSSPTSEDGTAEQPAADPGLEGAAESPRESASGDAPAALHALQLRAAHSRASTGQGPRRGSKGNCSMRMAIT